MNFRTDASMPLLLDDPLLIEHVLNLLDSYRYWTGMDLISQEGSPEQRVKALFKAKFTHIGFIETYRGVRISRSGRRFLIEQATVWNILDANGRSAGQAATF